MYSRRRNLALAAGPVAALAVGLGCAAAGLASPAAWTAAVTALCASWWVLEPVPVPVTSMLPFALFPLAGVLDHKEVAAAYGHTLVLLMMGGFILSRAMESSGAHRRLALGMVRLVGGGSARRLVLGFMLATAGLSMWMSNTATTLMMLPVALAVVEGRREIAAPLMLGIAWSASIGGMGTPIGTPPNVVFMGVYREATGTGIGFVEWMRSGLPAVCAVLPIAWWLLARRVPATAPLRLPASGPWRPVERRVLALFALTVLLWVTRSTPAGGWSGLLGVPGAGDSTVAMAAVVAAFLVPDGEGGRLLDWRTARGIPWGLLLLFGGGIAIARAFERSGLSQAIGSFLAGDLGIASWPAAAMVFTICLVVTFLTEVTSNTATTTLLMPVLAAAGAAAGVDPARLMVPAALSASCAFMLPVATPPNAIVYGSGEVSTGMMARAGLPLNLLGALAITGVMLLVQRG